jgi:hypothetical protein
MGGKALMKALGAAVLAKQFTGMKWVVKLLESCPKWTALYSCGHKGFHAGQRR